MFQVLNILHSASLATHALLSKCNATARLHTQLVFVSQPVSTSLAPGVTLTIRLICRPIVFSKPVLSPGSRPSPLYCVRHQFGLNCCFMLVLPSYTGIIKSQIIYIWPLSIVRNSGFFLYDRFDGRRVLC